MSLDAWKRGMIYMMSHTAFEKAAKGHARLDKGMAADNGLRIIRNLVHNQECKYVDDDLKANAPLQFSFFKNLLEGYGFSNVAVQKMPYQWMHCDPHAHDAVPTDKKECHVLITMYGTHDLALSTSPVIKTLGQRFTKIPNGGGRAAVKVKPKDQRDTLLIPRQDKYPFQAIPQYLLGGHHRVLV
jgi:hypothetical protein